MGANPPTAPPTPPQPRPSSSSDRQVDIKMFANYPPEIARTLFDIFTSCELYKLRDGTFHCPFSPNGLANIRGRISPRSYAEFTAFFNLPALPSSPHGACHQLALVPFRA
eukprot:6138399-Pleurochrysis_carterae.AAC.1